MPYAAVVAVGCLARHDDGAGVRAQLWQHDSTIRSDALAQSLMVEALVRQRVGAKPALVCQSPHEAAQLASNSSLQHVVHERMHAWCSGAGQ
jgi:elongation factor P--beta-lysine ligase